MTTSDVTIYHNPECGTSRNVLAMIRKPAGIEPTVIEYLKNPPDSGTTHPEMITSAGLMVRALQSARGARPTTNSV